MSAPEKVRWWDKLCVLLGLSWEVPEVPPAALLSTPPASPTQSIYAREARLQGLKFELAQVSGVLLAELSHDHEISLALERGDAVIVEVAAGTEAVTIHSVSVEDMATFNTLAEWAVFTCSGRDIAFASTFYRVDLQPMVSVREFLAGGDSRGTIWLSGPVKVCAEPSAGDDEGDTDSGPASAPVTVRLPRCR